MNKVELLAPAGNLSKLKTALYFGADAVYLGGKNFSLRSYADNFSLEELEEGLKLAHSINKKIYVTLNIYAKNDDFAELKQYAMKLEKIGVDAVLVSDPGVFFAIREVAPNLNIHISTQANTTNKYAVKFWGEQGATRVVLARELSLKEIEEIHEFCPNIELEAFVHGAMCISYSGRCLLSNYFTGRNSNRGECVQACRWEYELRKKEHEKYGSEYYPIEEDERGTYILNSKDLNMSAHLLELANSGVVSFKIEGRMKSEYYLATVVNAYRRAIDEYYEGKPLSKEIETELKNAAHRDYTTAYMFGENDDTLSYDNTQVKGACEYIANVIKSENGYIFVQMRNRFRKGDKLQILSPDDNFKKSFIIDEMFDEKDKPCDDAKLVQAIYKIKCDYPLKEGDLLRRE